MFEIWKGVLAVSESLRSIKVVRNVFGKALGLKRELQCLQHGKLQPRTDLAGGCKW